MLKNTYLLVIPVETGIQVKDFKVKIDSRLHGNDKLNTSAVNSIIPQAGAKSRVDALTLGDVHREISPATDLMQDFH